MCPHVGVGRLFGVSRIAGTFISTEQKIIFEVQQKCRMNFTCVKGLVLLDCLSTAVI